MTGTISFRIARDPDGVDFVKSNRDSQEVYDMNGIQHSGSLESGIYIIDGKKVLINR